MKCYMCGRTDDGEECTLTNPQKSKCRPDLIFMIDMDVFLCYHCLWTGELVNAVGRRFYLGDDDDVQI